MSTKRDILYVDDERSNLIVFEAIFEDDFEVHLADSAAEALALLDEMPIPVVIADQRMPDMTGVEMFSLIRRKHPHIQRVILSGYSESDAIIDAINQGQVFQFVRKPWHRPELLTVIRRAMDAHDYALQNTRMMERLLVAEQCSLLGKATGQIAHEMGNLLNLLPLIEVIEDEYAHDERLLQLSRLARSTHERLDRLVDEMKSLIRSEPREMELRLVSLADVVRELLSFLRFDRSIPSSLVLADLRCDPLVLGNKMKLHQVLLNLVKNSFDAVEGRPDGRIVVHLTCEAGRAFLSVADNGCGVPEEIRERIWDPFFSTKGDRGNGLGLDLVKHLVLAQHGQIECQSTVGEGTQFLISLPLVADPYVMPEANPLIAKC